jgi:mRNA interferase RelE/StbE
VRIRAAIAGLAQDPRPPGVKKLQGEVALWRIRIGSYRVVYSIDDAAHTVTVVKVADRRDVYR